MNTDRERKRQLYRTSEEYRCKQLARSKQTAERHRNDAEWLRLIQLRKDICRLRDSIADRLAHAARLERRLMRKIRQRDEIQARRKAAAI